MSNGVLPALLVLPVVGKSVHDVAVYAGEGEPAPGAAADGHSDQSDVRVGGLLWAGPPGYGRRWQVQWRAVQGCLGQVVQVEGVQCVPVEHPPP